MIQILMNLEGCQGIKFHVLTVAENFLSGTSDIEAIDSLLQMKAEIRLLEKLHAKIYISDNNTAIITSANLTKSGLMDNIEVGVRINNKANIISLVEKIKEWFKSGKLVDKNWLNSMRKEIDKKQKDIKELKQREKELYKLDNDLKGNLLPIPEPEIPFNTIIKSVPQKIDKQESDKETDINRIQINCSIVPVTGSTEAYPENNREFTLKILEATVSVSNINDKEEIVFSFDGASENEITTGLNYCEAYTPYLPRYQQEKSLVKALLPIVGKKKEDTLGRIAASQSFCCGILRGYKTGYKGRQYNRKKDLPEFAWSFWPGAATKKMLNNVAGIDFGNKTSGLGEILKNYLVKAKIITSVPELSPTEKLESYENSFFSLEDKENYYNIISEFGGYFKKYFDLLEYQGFRRKKNLSKVNNSKQLSVNAVKSVDINKKNKIVKVIVQDEFGNSGLCRFKIRNPSQFRIKDLNEGKHQDFRKKNKKIDSIERAFACGIAGRLLICNVENTGSRKGKNGEKWLDVHSMDSIEFIE